MANRNPLPITRRVTAEGSSRQVSRAVRAHHEARVAIILDTHGDAPMLELTENGYGDWQLVTRHIGRRDVTVLASGHIDPENDQ